VAFAVCLQPVHSNLNWFTLKGQERLKLLADKTPVTTWR